MLNALIKDLAASRHLTNEQVAAAVEQLVDDAVPAATKADFLCHLALKGETVDEIGAFARALREKSIAVPIDVGTRAADILDVCGTGGDRLNTFNISTVVAIICAAAGVAVAKHGNRAVTSQAGSADVLEELGVRIDASPEEAARSLRERHFAFFFAPNFHPAFKHIGAARKLCAERGQRTIFNFLGPLLNPARPTVQLVGVPRPELCDPLARVLRSLGVRRAMVVSGAITNHQSSAHISGHAQPFAHAPNHKSETAHLDEMSTLGPTHVAEFYQERGFNTSTLAPGLFPIQQAALSDLAGSDRRTNAMIVRRLLQADERGPKRDAVLLNAAAALFVANRARTLHDGWDLAAGLIDSGKALRKLEELASLGQPI